MGKKKKTSGQKKKAAPPPEPAPKPMPRGMEWIKDHPRLLIGAFVLVLYLPLVNTSVYFHGGDNACYLSLADSLVETQSYSNRLVIPGGPHTKYPFMYPLALGGLIGVFGKNVFMFKLLNVGAVLLTGIAFFGLVRQRGGTGAGLITTLVALSLPFTYETSKFILSDILFAGLVMAALWVFTVSEQGKNKGYFILSATLMVFAFFTRTAGLALVAAIIIAMAINPPLRQNLRSNFLRAGILGGIFLIAAGAWMFRNYRAGGLSGFDYMLEFLSRDPYGHQTGWLNPSVLAERVYTSFAFYLEIFGMNLIGILNMAPGKFPYVVAVIFGALIAAGFVKCLRDGPGLMEIFCVLYAGLIILWPFKSSRFLIPLHPLGVYYLMAGTAAALELLPLREKRSALTYAVMLMLFPLLSNLAGDVRLLKLKLKERSLPHHEVNPYFKITPPSHEWNTIMQMYVQAGKLSGSDDIILCRKPNLCSMITKKRCAGFPKSDDPQKILDLIERWGVDYVVFDEYHIENDRYLKPAILARPNGFEDVFHIPETNNMIFRVIYDR